MIAAFHSLGHLPLPHALAATLLYRLLSVWLPLPVTLGVTQKALRAAAR